MKKILFGLLTLALVSCGGEKEKDNSGNDTKQIEELVVEQGQAVKNPLLDSLNKILTNNPYSVEALVARSNYYRSIRNNQYAFADAEAAYLVDSANASALAVWGEVNILSNSRISRDAWLKCTQLHPENVECREKLAGLYHLVGEFEKSKKITDELIELDPENETAYFIRALDYLDGINDTDAALTYLQKAIDLKQDYFEALDKIAVLYTNMKNPLAEAYYKRMLELQPNNYLIHYNLGIYYKDVEDWNKSLESLTMASQISPNNPEVYFTLGTVHLKIDALQDAKSYFSKAIAISPSQANYRAYYARGYTNEILGDVTNARKDYQKAISFNPAHEPTKIALRRLQEQDAQAQ